MPAIMGSSNDRSPAISPDSFGVTNSKIFNSTSKAQVGVVGSNFRNHSRKMSYNNEKPLADLSPLKCTNRSELSISPRRKEAKAKNSSIKISSPFVDYGGGTERQKEALKNIQKKLKINHNVNNSTILPNVHRKDPADKANNILNK